MNKNFMRRFLLMALAAALLVVMLYSAQQFNTQGFGNKCTPAGTWWGGSDNLPVHAGHKYLMTIIPSRAGRFSVLFNGAYTMHDIGFPVETQWTGELVKKSGTFERNCLRSWFPWSICSLEYNNCLLLPRGPYDADAMGGDHSRQVCTPTPIGTNSFPNLPNPVSCSGIKPVLSKKRFV